MLAAVGGDVDLEGGGGAGEFADAGQGGEFYSDGALSIYAIFTLSCTKCDTIPNRSIVRRADYELQIHICNY